MRRFYKVIASLLLSVAVLFSLCGCGLDIELREVRNNDGWTFNRLDINLKSSLVEKLEATASNNGVKKWTVGDWISAYMEVVSDMYGFRYEYDGSYNENGVKTYRYNSIVVKEKDNDDYLTEALTLTGEQKVKEGFFIRRINVVRDDRFKWWIREFEDAYERFIMGGKDPNDNTTLMGIILFGCGYNTGNPLTYVEILPAFTDAFPAADFNTYTQTALHDLWYASVKMNVSSSRRDYDRDIYGNPTNTQKVYYIFDRKADDGETFVEYMYYRANPVGWYVVAILAGGAVVGLIFLGCYLNDKIKSKPKVKTEDLFPYDPFSE